MGMGKTGIACAQFLNQRGIPVRIMDNRAQPPGLSILRNTLPDIPYLTGEFNANWLNQAQEIILSPGLALTEATAHLTNSIPICSEIELFTRYANAPIVAITGSNGKSTVTTWLGAMAKQAGWQVQVGGNLGTPALKLLTEPAPDLYVLELSSFQLETTYHLQAKAAVILNLSEDHMDRYACFEDYKAAKQRIYQQTAIKIFNADDAAVLAMRSPDHPHFTFSLHPYQGDFHVAMEQGELCLYYQTQPLLPVSSMRLTSAIMRANALAALALAKAIDLPLVPCLKTVQEFTGLAHRCCWIGRKQNADWFNDSKGTNVGATLAAIQGLERPKQIILIAGGQGKGADFSPLRETVLAHCRACILIGEDAQLIAQALTETVPLYFETSMEMAVHRAAQLAGSGDAVLLSPACASFDMFQNYEHRGEVFTKLVQGLESGEFDHSKA